MVEKIVNLKVTDNIDQATQKVGSLKSELRKAQLEVATLSDKFGATSKEAIEAAKRAAELKDKIGDAKTLTDAFNPDAKFKSLSASISGVAGAFSAYQGAMSVIGVESKDFEKQMLRVQGAMAISQGLQGLGEAKDSFIQLKAVAVDAFKGIRAAIGSTGIGLLVIALGTIYAYWDDIKEAVSGVSEEQKKVNSDLNETAKKQKDALSTLNAQDETLKRQGKTEREILQLKEKQTQEVINTQIKAIQSNAILRKQQEESTIRNKEMLTEMLKVLLLPINYTLKAIDLIGQAMGKNFDLVKKFNGGIANLVFDPEEVKKQGDLTSKEEQKALKELYNQRDGYHNQIKTLDAAAKKTKDDAAKEARKKAEEEAKKNYDIEQSYLKQQNDLELKSLDEIDKAKKANEDRLKTEQQKAIDDENEAYKLKLENAKKFGQDTTDLEIEHLNNLNDINLKAQEKDYENKKNIAEKIAEFEKNKDQVIADSKQNLTNIVSGLEETGLAKTKEGQTVAKAIALTQIGIDSAVALSKASTLANAEGVAAQLAFPTIPGAGTAARIISYASTALSVFGNIARAKALLSSGGGGGGSSSGGTKGGGTTAPSFNIVGQNSNNQLAQSIAQKQSQPIEAYVVSGNISNAQSLDRNRVNTATFN